MNTIFRNWTHKETTGYEAGLVVTEHTLSELDMFSEESLAKLIETHPDAFSMVYAMPKEVGEEKEFREGDLRGASGNDVLAGIRKGQLWVQLLRLDELNEDYQALEKQIILEMEQNIPGMKIHGCRLSLLISSPSIHVAYHADIPHNVLWQIHGKKRVYIYPAKAPFISEEDLEGVFLGETQEAIHYDPDFDQHATVLDLVPGQVVTWPVNGPHRIENDDTLSVSIAMEFFDKEVLSRYAIYFTNGILRRRYHQEVLSTKTSGLTFWLKTLSAVFFKLTKFHKSHKRERYLTFKVDPDSETGFVDTPSVIRDF